MRESTLERHQLAGEYCGGGHSGAHLYGESLAEIKHGAVKVDKADVAIDLVEIGKRRLRVIKALHSFLHHQAEQAIAQQRLRVAAYGEHGARAVKRRSLSGIRHE